MQKFSTIYYQYNKFVILSPGTDTFIFVSMYTSLHDVIWHKAIHTLIILLISVNYKVFCTTLTSQDTNAISHGILCKLVHQVTTLYLCMFWIVICKYILDRMIMSISDLSAAHFVKFHSSAMLFTACYWTFLIFNLWRPNTNNNEVFTSPQQHLNICKGIKFLIFQDILQIGLVWY